MKPSAAMSRITVTFAFIMAAIEKELNSTALINSFV